MELARGLEVELEVTEMNVSGFVLFVLVLAAGAQEPATKKPDPKATRAMYERLIAIGERGVRRSAFTDSTVRVSSEDVRGALVDFEDMDGLRSLVRSEIERAVNRKAVVEKGQRLAADRSPAAQEAWRQKIEESDLALRVRLGVRDEIDSFVRKKKASDAEATVRELSRKILAEEARKEREAAEKREAERREAQKKNEEALRQLEERRREADAALRASLRVGAPASEIDASGSLPSSVTTTTDAGGTIEIRTYKHLRLSLTFRNDVLVSWTESSR